MANRNNRTPMIQTTITPDQSIYEEKPIKANLRELYIKTWVFRYAIKDYWPTPTPDDAFRFAFCEIGEALDAKLRLNPIYKRNRDIEANQDAVLNELADTVIMLLTALGHQYPVRRVNGIPNTDLDTLCTWVSDAWAAFRMKRQHRNPDRWRVITVGIIQSIAEYPGMDLNVRLTARLDRIMAKHGPEGGLAAITAPIVDTLAAEIMDAVLSARDGLEKRGEALAIIEEAFCR